ncbi:MAG: CHAT domain-containing protein [Acidobacteria bacterium]|nr:CHAT domain-containing protein [Acidobacteriota bacterium]
MNVHSLKTPNTQTIKSLEEKLKQLEVDRERLEHEIRQNHPRYAELHYPMPLSLEAIRRQLDDQAVLLEYTLGHSASFLFAVTKDDFLAVRLPDAMAIAEQVKTLREIMAARPQRQSFRAYVQLARELHQALIAPAGRMLTGKRHWVIVPDGILHYLPFEALLQSGDEEFLVSAGPRLWPYLIRDYAISYVPSASVLANLRQRPRRLNGPEKMFLAYADPLYGADATAAPRQVRSALGSTRFSQLKPLPHTRAEAHGIAALYPQNKVRLYLRDQAREENVKDERQLDQFRLIHFAAHGLLNEDQPAYSGLILSLPDVKRSAVRGQRSEAGGDNIETGGPQRVTDNQKQETKFVEDGLLQVYEIFNLKLNADLVVLSACETGLGKEVEGEGLVGLTQAFLYAGTASLVVSLWKVSDRSTPELMVSFYEYLNIGAVTKSEALRGAQLRLIKNGRYAHPYYWAPFILVGDDH